MRITARWMGTTGRNGTVPGRFATATEAEEAAREFMGRYPGVLLVSISHSRGGWCSTVERDGSIRGGWRKSA